MAQFTPEQFAEKLNQALKITIDAIPDILDQQANDAKAIIRDRFTQKGTMVSESGEEIAFPAYSEEYDKKKTKEGKQGAGSPNKLLYTGDMWRKTQIINRVKTNTGYSVSIGGTDQFSDEKLQYNSTRYGDVLKLSKKEIKLITDVTTDEITEIFKKALE